MRRFGWLACLALAAGCATSKAFVAPEYVSSGKIAVLPMDNQTNDLDGPVFIRKLIYEGLAARGFQVLPTGPIDDQLKANGFTDGGQLRATTPQKIAEWTGADTLVYATLENFDYIILGYYAQRRVKTLARLVDGKTGNKLWEAEGDASTRAIATNTKQAEQLSAVQLAIKFAEKLGHVPLRKESQLAVARLLNTLPNRH